MRYRSSYPSSEAEFIHVIGLQVDADNQTHCQHLHFVSLTTKGKYGEAGFTFPRDPVPPASLMKSSGSGRGLEGLQSVEMLSRDWTDTAGCFNLFSVCPDALRSQQSHQPGDTQDTRFWKHAANLKALAMKRSASWQQVSHRPPRSLPAPGRPGCIRSDP